MMYRVCDFVVWYSTVHAFSIILIPPLTMGRFLSVHVPTSRATILREDSFLDKKRWLDTSRDIG
ncbi:hypothetical protein BDV36DRAFT_252384 [Aspergillus pseudocaelatus]|uniref:Uncharacterized protein n=1 Tax=Aspergillus pseudocaelatus TaxID=1825620 RepID=A0ABQ6WTZ5_9EURO|nr:hypothetical protein BDV36DRAFT_252384 [Aspergillus pseudocaelatus]